MHIILHVAAANLMNGFGTTVVRRVVNDCIKPFASEFRGQYMRFWLSLVNNIDAPHLLRNLISLLSKQHLGAARHGEPAT